jgi:phosphoglycerate dehydrogenase-like enzyme
MHKLLILSRYGDEYRHWVDAAALPDLEIVTAPGPGCDIVFGEPILIRDILQQLPDLDWVQATFAGVEPLLDRSLRRDYLLTNARGVFGGLMSEFVFGYLLLHARRIVERLELQRQHQWDPTTTGTLRGKTIGLLGVGSIGAVLAGTARHFKMTVRGYTHSSETCPDVNAYYHGKDLLEFGRGLDYLVSVLPNTAGTRGIVDASLIGVLPSHALFVNVGRGSALDESALAEALDGGRIAGAVLDVFQQEPLPPEHRFWRTKNLFITSHTSAPSFPEDITALFVENYHRLMRGEPLNYPVNFEKGY